jgi:hypothetical protein
VISEHGTYDKSILIPEGMTISSMDRFLPLIELF